MRYSPWIRLNPASLLFFLCKAFGCADFINAVIYLSPADPTIARALNVVFLFGVLTLGNCAVAAYFLHQVLRIKFTLRSRSCVQFSSVDQGIKFKKPLIAFLFPSRVNANPNVRASLTRVGRLCFWLAVSGLCLVTSIVAFAFVFAVVMFSWSGESNYIVSTVVFTYARIGASFAQVSLFLHGKAWEWMCGVGDVQKIGSKGASSPFFLDAHS